VGTIEKSTSIGSIVLSMGKDLFSISIAKIEYIETGNKRCTIHFVGDKEQTLTVRSQDLEKQILVRPEFARVHRNYIVNLDCMRTIEAKKIVSVSNNLIPIAANYEEKVRDAFIKRLYCAVRQ